MDFPQGSVPGLCTSGVTGLALSVAFLGAWGFQGAGEWRPVHLLVLVPLFCATLCFGFTPYFATGKRENGISIARGTYGAGVVLLLLSVAAALVIAYTFDSHDVRPTR